MTISSLHELLRITLQRLHRTASQIAALLPRVAEQVESPELLDALGSYAGEVERQAERAERALDILQAAPDSALCSGVEGLLGLLEEGGDVRGDGRVSDVAFIAALRRIGFSTISAYHTTRVLAEVLGLSGVLGLVEDNLRSEELFERILTVLSDELLDEVSGGGVPFSSAPLAAAPLAAVIAESDAAGFPRVSDSALDHWPMGGIDPHG
jgi:ferritin-like metal-binding protein YciE